jgi:hypothetical protein
VVTIIELSDIYLREFQKHIDFLRLGIADIHIEEGKNGILSLFGEILKIFNNYI